MVIRENPLDVTLCLNIVSYFDVMRDTGLDVVDNQNDNFPIVNQIFKVLK